MIFFNSGITETNRSTLKIRSSLNTKKLELLGMGISEMATMMVSKIFQPLLKKTDFFFSPKKRIKISITKKIVIE